MIEDNKPIKIEKTEVVDETDVVRHGYVRKTRSRAWTSKGRQLCLFICRGLRKDFAISVCLRFAFSQK